MADVVLPHDYHPSTLHMGDCSVCGHLQRDPLHVPITDTLLPYVEALGVDGAVAMFLQLGGSQIYLPVRSGAGTAAAKAIGAENVERLAAVMGAGYIKVPLARQWVAAVLSAQGKSNNEIARLVRADIATVGRWLGPKASVQQLNLPL